MDLETWPSPKAAEQNQQRDTAGQVCSAGVIGPVNWFKRGAPLQVRPNASIQS